MNHFDIALSDADLVGLTQVRLVARENGSTRITLSYDTPERVVEIGERHRLNVETDDRFEVEGIGVFRTAMIKAETDKASLTVTGVKGLSRQERT